jgi:hypothetical protein
VTTDTSQHPSEEELIAFAFEGNDGPVAAHVAGCAVCRQFVAEMAALRTSLSGLDDNEPDPGIGHRIARSLPPPAATSVLGDIAGLFTRIPALLPLLYFVYIVLAFFIFNYLNDLSIVK